MERTSSIRQGSAAFDEALETFSSLSRNRSDRDHGVLVRPARELRVRALSALVADYDELRRMMTFLRWHEGDVDAIIPSLYAGRGRRSSELETESDGPEVRSDGESPSEPNVPMPVNGSGPFTQ